MRDKEGVITGIGVLLILIVAMVLCYPYQPDTETVKPVYLYYKQKVKIVKGFYMGNYAKVLSIEGYYSDCPIRYDMRLLDNGDVVTVCGSDVQPVVATPHEE